ncbi:MAG: ATP-binding protein [Candidatus Thermoplasmatota archaeon]|nr:ATP-binding protein [Candidatus Thermoplasmatota archaeon]
MRESHSKGRSSLSEKQYVLGRRHKTTNGVLNIGRYYALDGSLGAPVYLDVLRPHMILICGKRGYGKSYSIGVFLEEMAGLPNEIKQNLSVVVLDSLGIFWSTQFPSKDNLDTLQRWERKPQGIPIRLVVPAYGLKNHSTKDMVVDRFSLCAAELSPLHWCQLFDVKATDPVGVALTRAILAVQSSKVHFSLSEVIAYIQQDVQLEDVVKYAVQNFFIMADSWGLFDKDGLVIRDLVQPGVLTILDLSVLHSPILKDIVVALLSEKIFEERIKSRKILEQKKMGFSTEETTIPLVWFVIDEAQLFIPSEKKTLSKEVLIEEWMRQGRQPGLSLLLATQRPSAVEPEVLSHSDIIMCHRLTAQEDIEALRRIRPTYMQGDIVESIKKIGSEKGVALLIDDTSESVHVIQLRPRISWHGGAEPVINDGG